MEKQTYTGKIGGTKAAVISMIKTIIVFAIFIIWCTPFALVVINSLKRKVSIVKYPFQIIDSKGVQWQNYPKAFTQMGYLRAFGNSLMITATSILLLVVLSSMCAYILARRDYFMCKITYYALISYMIVPFQVIMIPVLGIYGGKLGLLNSRFVLIIMNFAYGTGFATFLCHRFIKTGIPKSLEEAAFIDGASTLQTYRTVIFPLLKPILATNMILQTLGLWNDYMLPNLVLTRDNVKTLPIVIRTFVGSFSSDFGLMMAALVMCIAPILILFLSMQKFVISGVMAGAVKE